MTDTPHYAPLCDAPVGAKLTLLEINSSRLTHFFQHLGMFKGSSLTRHDSEIHYHPMRVRGDNGDVVVPAGFGIKAVVHIDGSKERKPMTEMEKKESGHVETISGGKGMKKAMAQLGLDVDSAVTFIRDLPHMDYVTLIDRRQRTRISEGEAAKIWGEYIGRKDRKEGQFYFSRKGEEFAVTGILGGKRIQHHLSTHGIKVGASLIMEIVEQAQELHKPMHSPVVVSSAGGLRFYLTAEEAEQVVVRLDE